MCRLILKFDYVMILHCNYLQRSDGGGVFDAVDEMNGHTLCGCNTVTACQVLILQKKLDV